MEFRFDSVVLRVAPLLLQYLDKQPKATDGSTLVQVNDVLAVIMVAPTIPMNPCAVTKRFLQEHWAIVTCKHDCVVTLGQHDVEY